jgi:hypothetical protein
VGGRMEGIERERGMGGVVFVRWGGGGWGGNVGDCGGED